jgi:hypothetical protein
VPALARSRALSQGVLVGLSSSAAMRTNVGLFNPNDTFTDVDLELRGADGSVAATRVVTLPPMTLTQLPMASLFTAAPDAMPNASITFLAGAPLFAFGSVIDNASGDATFVDAQDMGGLI